MKIILLLISTIVILYIDPSFEVPYAKIENAFNSNDAKTIISFGKDKILLKIIDKEGAYNPTQATLILQDFFTKKPKKGKLDDTYQKLMKDLNKTKNFRVVKDEE